MSAVNTARTRLIDEIRMSLGNNQVDIELDPENYEFAITKALEKYRQLSSNSVEESYAFLEVNENQNVYYLGQEVIEVRQIFRRSIGPMGSGGTQIDPFDLAYTNIYLLQAGSGGQGGLATYDFFMGWQETAGKLFGFFIDFNWDTTTKKLQLIRRPYGKENLLLQIYNYKPDDSIINNIYSKPWIRDYAIAEAKIMLGNAYRKFNSIPGPSGSITLPGDQLITEANDAKTKLEEDVYKYGSGETTGLYFVIG